MSSQLEDAFNEAVQRRAFEHEHQRILALLDSVEAEEAVVNALMRAVEAGADLGSEARTAITALVGLVESDRPTGKTGSVSYRVRDEERARIVKALREAAHGGNRGQPGSFWVGWRAAARAIEEGWAEKPETNT